MFPERKNTLRMDDGDITQKITYENAKALYVSIERNFGNLEKLDTYIEVPTQINTKNNTLECVSLIIHYGGVKGGHYTTLIKYNNIWYEYDDMKRSYEQINRFCKKHLTNVTGVLFLEKRK
jgi:ubiquitin C-terminal hydrolase